MLSFEWRELETLYDRLSDLRHRYAAAHRTKHPGLVEALKGEIAKLRQQREQLVQHIAARLGSVAGERRYPSESGDHGPADRHDPEPWHKTAVNAASADRSPRL